MDAGDDRIAGSSVAGDCDADGSDGSVMLVISVLPACGVLGIRGAVLCRGPSGNPRQDS